MKYRLFKIVVAVSLMAALCFYASPREILHAVGGINVWCLAVVTLMMPLYMLCRTLKWFLLVRQTDPSLRFMAILPPYLRGMLVGFFTPLRLGEATRAIGTGNTSIQFVLFIVEKMIETFCLFFLCSIVLIKVNVIVSLVLALLCLSVLLARRVFTYAGIRCVHLLYRLLQKPESSELLQAERKMEKLNYLGCATLSLCVFIIFMVQVYLLMLGMDPQMPFSIIFDFPIVLLGNVFPVTIGGFGVRETIAVILLTPKGISAATVVISFAIVAVLDLVVPAFLGTILTLFHSKGSSEISSPVELGCDSEDWEQFWRQRDCGLIGRLLSYIRRRFVTPRLVTLVLNNTDRGTLVEAGCGTGEVSLQCARVRGDRVILVDRSPSALAMAQEKSNELGVDAETLQCDIASLSGSLKTVPDATVFNIGVIEHFSDCSDILHEMLKVSGRNAFAVIPECSLFWRAFVAASYRLKLVPASFFIRLYSRDDLRSVVENAGLRVLKMSRVRIFGVIPYLGVCFENISKEGLCNEATS